MIPFAVVVVDSGFLTIIFALVGILPVVGIAVGVFIFRFMAGSAAKAAWAAKRKNAPGLFHMGRDGIFKLWNIKRSFGGVWHAGTSLDVIPDERGVKGMVGGTPTGLASTNAAATLDPEWLYATNRFADSFKRERTTESGEVIPKMAPPMASNYLDALRYREAEIQSVLETLNRINSGEISIEDGVTASMAERGIDPSDMNSKSKIRDALMGAVQSQGQSYKTELERIEAAKVIKFNEDRWIIDWEKKPVKKGNSMLSMFTKPQIVYNAKNVMAMVPISMLDFQSFLQTGANLDDLTTALRNSAQAAILESSQSRGQAFKWISLGVFIFIVMISIYVVLQGLHMT